MPSAIEPHLILEAIASNQMHDDSFCRHVELTFQFAVNIYVKFIKFPLSLANIMAGVTLKQQRNNGRRIILLIFLRFLVLISLGLLFQNVLQYF